MRVRKKIRIGGPLETLVKVENLIKIFPNGIKRKDLFVKALLKYRRNCI